jgi:hypothetical protein
MDALATQNSWLIRELRLSQFTERNHNQVIVLLKKYKKLLGVLVNEEGGQQLKISV